VTLQQSLQYGTTILEKTSESPALDAEILLSFVLKKDRVFLFTYPEKKLNTRQWRQYKKLISRRKKHEPIAYITHHKEFYGLDFYVDCRVLIPRPETEKLVEKIINFLKDKKYYHSLASRFSNLLQNDLVICDIGTGSGCIAVSLAKNLPKAKIYAIDASKKALAVAKINAKKHKVFKQIKFVYSDLFSKIPPKIKFDIIVANLPYLSKKEWQKTTLDIRKYEPKFALIGGKKGKEIYKKLLKQAKKYLKENGKIFLENYP